MLGDMPLRKTGLYWALQLQQQATSEEISRPEKSDRLQ